MAGTKCGALWAWASKSPTCSVLCSIDGISPVDFFSKGISEIPLSVFTIDRGKLDIADLGLRVTQYCSHLVFAVASMTKSWLRHIGDPCYRSVLGRYYREDHRGSQGQG
jgi:hypothetical protein